MHAVVFGDGAIGSADEALLGKMVIPQVAPKYILEPGMEPKTEFEIVQMYGAFDAALEIRSAFRKVHGELLSVGMLKSMKLKKDEKKAKRRVSERDGAGAGEKAAESEAAEALFSGMSQKDVDEYFRCVPVPKKSGVEVEKQKGESNPIAIGGSNNSVTINFNFNMR